MKLSHVELSKRLEKLWQALARDTAMGYGHKLIGQDEKDLILAAAAALAQQATDNGEAWAAWDAKALAQQAQRAFYDAKPMYDGGVPVPYDELPQSILDDIAANVAQQAQPNEAEERAYKKGCADTLHDLTPQAQPLTDEMIETEAAKLYDKYPGWKREKACFKSGARFARDRMAQQAQPDANGVPTCKVCVWRVPGNDGLCTTCRDNA